MRVPPHLYQKYQVSSSNQKTRKIYQILYYEKQNNVHTSWDGLLWKLISCQASFPQQSRQAKGRSRRMQMLPYPEDLVKEQNVDLSLLLMTHQTKEKKNWKKSNRHEVALYPKRHPTWWKRHSGKVKVEGWSIDISLYVQPMPLKQWACQTRSEDKYANRN